ncbi:hypothetical protein [Paraburkholderia caffeinilytica]|uniref:hypothetical protein n=1 Tax=Paraburkholderia caffeinilytica TaxID=1761016 RepID=UPI003D9FD829
MKTADHAPRECAGEDLEIVVADKEVRRRSAHVHGAHAPKKTQPLPFLEVKRDSNQCVTIAALI